MKNRWSPAGESREGQLSLPGFGLEPPAPLAARAPTSVKSPRGFVRLMRDPDVAKSYSDNVALGYAIAQGLARALGRLSPRELADLRARVSSERPQVTRPNGEADFARTAIPGVSGLGADARREAVL